MHDLVEFLNQSLDDGYLSKSEKKALKAAISEKAPNKRELDWLRSQIFEIAREKMKGFENVQVLEWLENANKLILPKMTTDVYCKSYFSPGPDCLGAVNEQISFATKTIDICVFTISDDRIKEKILYAHKKGVRVRIITDNDKSFDRGSDIHSLSASGIPVKIDSTDNHMHHKFAVFDNKVLLTGSFNWTRSATEYNQENILITNDGNAVKRYISEFDRLWGEMERY